jgi:hypothetical protein
MNAVMTVCLLAKGNTLLMVTKMEATHQLERTSYEGASFSFIESCFYMPITTVELRQFNTSTNSAAPTNRLLIASQLGRDL